MIPESDRTLILPEAVYLALEECAAKERKKATNELFGRLITQKSAAQAIIRRAMVEKGHLDEGRK